jgi:pimeloyl-ACP methyl ester carboxylesterase
MEKIRVPAAVGRTLDVWVQDPPEAIPLVVHHGTPSSGLPYPPFVDEVTRRGLRWVSYSRPGYGDSLRQPGRIVADCATDVAAILDHLESERCYTIGGSGGGPHALACAALLPERTIAATTVAGVAPYRAEGLDFLAGMGPENVEEFGAALAGQEKLEPILRRWADEYRHVTAEAVAEALGGLVSDVDKAVLTGEFAQAFVDSYHEGARTGIWGWYDDDIAFTVDWGFDLASIRVPVMLWQGHQDLMVPLAHGRWLAEHVADARARMEPDHGHLSLYVGSFGTLLDDMLERAPTH